MYEVASCSTQLLSARTVYKARGPYVRVCACTQGWDQCDGVALRAALSARNSRHRPLLFCAVTPEITLGRRPQTERDQGESSS